MDGGKIEPRLAREIEQAEEAGDPDRRIPVIVELAGGAEVAPSREEPGARLERLEQTVRELQAGVVQRLRELDAGEVEQLTLANALSARLTPTQIASVAERGDVKIIRLSREEQVTAAGS